MPGSLLETINSGNSDKDQLRPAVGSTLPRSSAFTLSSGDNLKSTNYNNGRDHTLNNQLISSARSDRSDCSNCDSEGGGSTSTTTSTSNKKVSFNKAVRVKKYSSPPTHSGDLSESKFWFRVHKADDCGHLNSNNQSNHQQQLTTTNNEPQQQRHQHSPSQQLIQSLPSKGKLDLSPSPSSSIDNHHQHHHHHLDSFNSSQLLHFNSLSPSVNCVSHCANFNGDEPLIEREFNLPTKSSDKSTDSRTEIITTMPPISNSRKEPVKIIDYSVDDEPITTGTKMTTTSSKGSVIDEPNLKSSSGKSTHRIINYEPYKSASTIALDIDSSLRPRSPSPVSKNGRRSSVDSITRTVTPNPDRPNSVIVTSTITHPIRPGSMASEEVIETKTIEKKNPLLSGVKVMFGVKAKRAPTFPTMPNRSKSVDRTNSPTVNKPMNKQTATIVRPTFASRTTTPSTLRSREPTTTSTLRSTRPSESQPLKPSLTSSRNPPLVSSLKKTQAPTPTKTSVRDLSASRVSTKSPSSLVSSEINKLMSSVSSTKKPSSTTATNEMTSKKVVEMKDKDEIDTGTGSGAVEMARERPADQTTGDLTPVATWSSGPVLISNVANKETTSSYIPGEGKLMASFEEGTKVWKSKTRRVYEEPIKIPRESSASPERKRADGSPERLRIKSKSPDRHSSSSRHQSPDRLRERSPTRDRSSSPTKSTSSHRRSASPERPTSSAGYRSPTRHRSPSPIMIERQSPAVTPITVDIGPDEDAIDGGASKRSNRTRFSPTHETFYRSSSSISDNHKSLPTGDDLDEIFLRKDIYPNDRESNQREEREIEEVVEFTPKMEDKACQCNLKRSKREKNETDSLSGIGYRVIKPANDGSVSTFSNVPDISDAETDLDRRSERPMSREGSPVTIDRRSPQNNHHHSEVIYSQIDRTKKRPNNQSSPSPIDNDHYHRDLDQPGEYGPDDYLYESNAIKSARSSVSPSRGETTRRPMETSSYRHQSPSPSPSRRYMFELDRKRNQDSRNPNKTVSVTHKTYGFNMRTALDAPEVHLPTRPPSTKPVRVIEAPYHHHQPQHYPYHPHDEVMSRSTNGRLESHHQMKSRMRTESLSGDEMIHNRRGSLSDPDDLIAPKSIIREIDHRKGEINYENVSPHNRSTGMRNSIYEDGQLGNNSMWFRSLEDDYRKGLSDRESFNNSVNHHHHPRESSNHNVTDYCTMSRRGRDRLPSSRDVGADYPPPSAMTHAYTLDRRHLDRAKRSKRPTSGYSMAGSHLGISSPSMSNNGLNSSANSNSPSMAMRKYNSTRDLSHLNSQPDFMDLGSTRGGLAAAYKARQRRASSLSRFGQPPNGYLPASPSSNLYPRTSHSVLSSPNYPLHSGSHSQLHRLHLTGSEIGGYHPHHHYTSHHHPLRSSASHIGASYGHSSSESDVGLGSHHRTMSGSRSRLTTAHHQNDPVVLYIPAISHHHRPVDEDDRNSALGIARTQSILSSSKRSVKSGLSTKDKKHDPSKDRDANFNEITSKVNGYLSNGNTNTAKNNKKNQITSTGLMNEGEDDEIIELRDEDDDSNNNKTAGKKKDVKRSVSIPKDTKLPWLQKLKMKVKS